MAGVNVGLAFIAGLLSFLSPCVLPLIPSYLSLIAGTSLENLTSGSFGRRSVLMNTVFFVLGFSVVFVTLGVVLSGTLGLLSGALQVVNIVAGILVIALGLNFIFDFWKLLSFDKRLHLHRRPGGFAGAALIGMAFGAGWSPCIGPILGSILLLAGTTGKIPQGILLLSVYSLGLGVPFVLTGAFFTFALRQMQRIRPYLRFIKIASGAFLVLMGVLILLGRMQQINSWLFASAYRLEDWQVSSPQGPAVFFGAIFFLLFLLLALFAVRRIGRKPPEDSHDSTVGESLRRIGPARLIFIAIFLTLSILSFTGVLDFAALLSGWLGFQGL